MRNINQFIYCEEFSTKNKIKVKKYYDDLEIKFNEKPYRDQILEDARKQLSKV